MHSNHTPDPCNLVIFGVFGDLSQRKLIPSIYHLEEAGLLPEATRIIGLARNDYSQEDFHNQIADNLRKFVKQDLNQNTLNALIRRLSYICADFAHLQDYQQIQSMIDTDLPVIYYLATPASVYVDICTRLSESGLIKEASQVVMEKPIGDSLQSSRKVNDMVGHFFSEGQIYRIDHYLGKETVLNLLVLRFANALFTTNWDHNCIDHVQITVAESMGIGDRWSFYDKAGQLRDMVQNHLLQILCLLAMEPPFSLDEDSIRSEKLKVLKALRPITQQNVSRKVVRGQYIGGFVQGEAVAGYAEEAGANTDSRTETFVAIKAEIDNWRWTGVPFYLRTGKRLATKHSEISVHFRAQPHNIFKESYRKLPPNKLNIRLQPDEGIELQMVNKVPGITEISRIEKNRLDLSFTESFGDKRIVDAYERLLLEVMLKNQSWFVSREEVELAWSWVDDIIEAWARSGEAPDPYPAGSWGPSSSIALIARDHRHWDE